ncbi:ABC transporter substrate-binding protein [Candidatus Desantisbacteria bacterium CG_4_8_14_3_um_filter_40_12]|uniref:ABC transporter substrate-binding protein n=1 Tax=Candidatus Desantisbacteria bacterium CG_4_8_14_3_um_filter_40_12 TaxID=1974545 RepID=A0A2M7JCL3_9BACT|nr:MAG: ABC transporter substrate-binding protein [Candidatus Desantisbacteria bacterium CG_4_8_14_3_um_filter_40_12]
MFRIILFFLIFTLSAVGCTKHTDTLKKGASKYGGTLLLSTTSDPKSFNEIIAKESSTSRAIGFLFEGLTKTNGVTTEVEPCLAEEWNISGNGLVWTFFLRKDVKWFDGKPFTSDDVLFTYNSLIYNKDIPSSARDIFTIEGKQIKFEKIDDYTVKLTLPIAFAPLLRLLGQSILPKHALEEAVKAGKFNSTWGVDTLPSKIIGTGPFMLTEFKPSERLVYTKNPNYWQKDKEGKSLPYIDKIVSLIVEKDDIQLVQFESKEIDVLSIREKDFAYLKKKEQKGNYTVYDCGPSFGTNFISFNQNPNVVKQPKLSWFRDKNFRKAIAQSIDKQTIINNVMNGIGYPQDAAMEKAAVIFHNPFVTRYEYDLNEAKRILVDAGYKDNDGDGIIEDKGGNPIKFTLITNADNTIRQSIGTIIVTDLKKLGMDVSFTPMEFNSMVTKLTSTYDWDAVLIGLTGDVEPHGGKNVWTTDGHLHLWNMKPTDAKQLKIWEKYLPSWETELDSIFNKGVSELDVAKRKALYWRWQEIVAEELPVIYTVNGAALHGVRNRFGNLQPTSYGGVLHNVEKVCIEE